ncbi:MAG: GNAT family N-acetyltransferase [Bacteroidetes bacterium]|nr:MAG: GNAT family N-acetyltransferase [Bacteroidota bacterium]
MQNSLIAYYRPQKLSASRLDQYLAGAWFRSSNNLFKVKMLILDGELCTVLNIRLDLRKHAWSQSMRKIKRKNKAFRVETGPLKLCAQMERLYHLTTHRFKGFVFPDLFSFLYDYQNKNIFHSWHIKVWDGDRLVAASVFDMGNESMMSVLGLYDPEYMKYSPGMYTMMQEVELAKQKGLKWYYPGYVLAESKLFDYKLNLGTYHYYRYDGKWIKDPSSLISESPVHEIQGVSAQLELALKKSGIPHQRLLYKLYSLGFAYEPGTFVKHPLIFMLPELTTNPFKLSIAAYNFELKCFELCHPMMVQDSFIQENQREEYEHIDVYYDHILQDSPEDIEYFDKVEDLLKRIKEMLIQKEGRFGFEAMHFLK